MQKTREKTAVFEALLGWHQQSFEGDKAGNYESKADKKQTYFMGILAAPTKATPLRNKALLRVY